MANDNTKVGTGKPKVTGVIHVAALGTTMPTDTTTTLDTKFKCIGYISEDGIVNSNGFESNDIRAFGGDVVYSSETGHTDTFAFTMIECLNEEALKLRYGSANVTGTLSAGMTVKVNSIPKDKVAMVIDQKIGDAAKRICVPTAKVTAAEDITYKDDELVAYGVTMTAYADANGVTHTEYIKGGA